MARDREGRALGGGFDLGGELLAWADLSAGDDDIGTGFREASRERCSQPSAAAGDDRDLAGQLEAIKDRHHTLPCAERSKSPRTSHPGYTPSPDREANPHGEGEGP